MDLCREAPPHYIWEHKMSKTNTSTIQTPTYVKKNKERKLQTENVTTTYLSISTTLKDTSECIRATRSAHFFTKCSIFLGLQSQ
jgi:hypothetical protein